MEEGTDSSLQVSGSCFCYAHRQFLIQTSNGLQPEQGDENNNHIQHWPLKFPVQFVHCADVATHIFYLKQFYTWKKNCFSVKEFQFCKYRQVSGSVPVRGRGMLLLSLGHHFGFGLAGATKWGSLAPLWTALCQSIR